MSELILENEKLIQTCFNLSLPRLSLSSLIYHSFMLQTGGPSWEVPLGRRDSRSASLSGSNNNIPAPNNTFQTILTKFKLQGLNIVDLVALSGILLELVCSLSLQFRNILDLSINFDWHDHLYSLNIYLLNRFSQLLKFPYP